MISRSPRWKSGKISITTFKIKLKTKCWRRMGMFSPTLVIALASPWRARSKIVASVGPIYIAVFKMTRTSATILMISQKFRLCVDFLVKMWKTLTTAPIKASGSSKVITVRTGLRNGAFAFHKKNWATRVGWPNSQMERSTRHKVVNKVPMIHPITTSVVWMGVL